MDDSPKVFGFKVEVHFDYGVTETWHNVSEIYLRDEQFILVSDIHDKVTTWPDDYIAAFEVTAETEIAEAF